MLQLHPKLKVTAGATVKVADWSESSHRGLVGVLVFDEGFNKGQWGILTPDGKTVFGVPEWDVEHYYGETVEEDPLGDYCLYCGTYQGPEGELRSGFDCHYCGCN